MTDVQAGWPVPAARTGASLPAPTAYSERQLKGEACCWCRLPGGGHVSAGFLQITDWAGSTSLWQLKACTACAANWRIGQGPAR